MRFKAMTDTSSPAGKGRPSVHTMKSVSDYPTLAMAMRAKLEEAFEPTHLVIEDQSHLHAGHGGAREHAARHGSGESHFHVSMASDRFRELPRVARHQAVHQVLSEIMPRIHALSLDLREEAGPANSDHAKADSGGGTVQGHDPINRDPDTGKSRAWVSKDTTKARAFKAE